MLPYETPYPTTSTPVPHPTALPSVPVANAPGTAPISGQEVVIERDDQPKEFQSRDRLSQVFKLMLPRSQPIKWKLSRPIREQASISKSISVKMPIEISSN